MLYPSFTVGQVGPPRKRVVLINTVIAVEFRKPSLKSAPGLVVARHDGVLTNQL